MQLKGQKWEALETTTASHEILGGMIIWLAVLRWSTHAAGRALHTNQAAAFASVAAGGFLLLLGAAIAREAARSMGRLANWLLRLSLPVAITNESSSDQTPLPLAPRASAVSARERNLRVTTLSPGTEREFFEMAPREFEDAVAELFQHHGFRVEQMPFVNDGGKDAIAWRDGFKYVVECKRYERSQAVHRRDMQILAAAMQDESAHGGYYVTTGRFTRPAIEYAAVHHIELVDGETLTRIVAHSGCAKR